MRPGPAGVSPRVPRGVGGPAPTPPRAPACSSCRVGKQLPQPTWRRIIQPLFLRDVSGAFRTVRVPRVLCYESRVFSCALLDFSARPPPDQWAGLSLQGGVSHLPSGGLAHPAPTHALGGAAQPGRGGPPRTACAGRRSPLPLQPVRAAAQRARGEMLGLRAGLPADDLALCDCAPHKCYCSTQKGQNTSSVLFSCPCIHVCLCACLCTCLCMSVCTYVFFLKGYTHIWRKITTNMLQRFYLSHTYILRSAFLIDPLEAL